MQNINTQKTIIEKPHVLYIDDEVNNLQSFKANFREYYKIFTAETAAAGKTILRENDIHIIRVHH
jgi:two-component system, sensor histidine kinase and response regulator